MNIFFYGDLKVGDILTIGVGDKQVQYKILHIDTVEYQGKKFLRGSKSISEKKEEVERGNLFSLLFESKSDLVLQLDIPMKDRPKFVSKLFIELERLD